MSAPTPPKKERKRHPVMHHATKPHGLLVIGGVIFALAWYIWTFYYS